ncbi:MAG: aldehyde dehydrogenase [Gloeocapsa sp. DLM2.Bin57]|nr:MAG: aldehyde dehydrogenase [Gloeocapsa sp. DLM2.Bin57]
MVNFPQQICNWINGQEIPSQGGAWFSKLNPCNGQTLCQVTRSQAEDVATAVDVARKQFTVAWSEIPPVQRGEILHNLVLGLKARQEEIAKIVAAETGKSFASALGETQGAIALGLFYASEGQRLYGRTTTSAVPHKHALTVRQPLGVAGLIIAANTPIANVAWKVFPALICGNTAVLKAAEDTPITAWIFGQIAQEAGLPPGVLNIIQGYGEEAGAPLVAHQDIDIISFTGSTAVGRQIQTVAGPSLKRISLELGGKNPLVVCDDADLDNAVNWTILSAFSNAGQRCAAGSRIIIFESIYDQFRDLLVAKTKQLKVGPKDTDDLGPVINNKQLQQMLRAIATARANGAKILSGGDRLTDSEHQDGYYLAPTLLENISPEAAISQTELFGPIAILYSVPDFNSALALANNSPYGLTASIHTGNLHRAIRFCEKVQAGVAVVNGGTYGSEPHMPFGGFKQSGNGTREPGTEALDVYSELKDIYINIDPNYV